MVFLDGNKVKKESLGESHVFRKPTMLLLAEPQQTEKTNLYPRQCGFQQGKIASPALMDTLMEGI
jgi:hypothetical protein